MKVVIRVKTPVGEKYFTRKVESDGSHVIIRKARGKGQTGWTLSFTGKSLVAHNGIFDKKPRIDAFYDSPQAIEYDYQNQEIDNPLWNKRDEENLFKAAVIKAAGATIQKLEIPLILYIMVAGTLIIGVIQFLSSRGIRFG